ncbi:multidrug resistance protein 4 [Amanita muscaria]
MSEEHSHQSSSTTPTPTLVSYLSSVEKDASILAESPQQTTAREQQRGLSTDEKAASVQEVVIDDWNNDPDNARNWPVGKKWVTVSIVSLYTFVSPLASSMMAPGLPNVAIQYNIQNPTIVALTLSVFLLSFALAPLVMAPLSEIYGRTWVLHVSNIFTVIFSLGCAFSPTTGSLIAFRFLSGASGAAPIAIGGGSVGDLFSERDRATAMAVYTLGPLIGPVIGPIAGGFIAQSIGIKWVFIVIAVISALASLIGIPLLRETYAPVIQVRKLKGQANDPEKAAKLQKLLETNKSKWQLLWENFSRPVILLTRSLICFLLSLYMAFVYGIYYLMFSTFAALYSGTYGFKTGVAGLTYLGLGVGFLLGSVFGAKTADQIYKKLADKNGGKGTPEMRIPALFIGSVVVPIGLLWYGWSAQAKTHWIVPIIGTGFYGFGIIGCFLPTTLYLVDAFTYAASAVAAASVLRSLLAFAFPLFGSQMYAALGLGGGNSLLAGLAIVLGVPFPVWLYYKGESMRARSSLTK